ncbi:MAG: RICIN domain-containing protein [Dysgonamonadaceae bacterium]|jgi:hypothetical protein|nr:RICIN domain-containing protein [Dysgonamonadaceae bacterium]
MKIEKKFLFVVLFLILFIFYFPIVNAQVPITSTAADPIWYYIQVQGENERADRVFTVVGTQVYGRAISMASPSEIDNQLWRFEQSGDSYIIFNRATGKKLDVTYNSSKSITVGALSDHPVTRWQWSKSGDWYNIKATVAPTGGDASKIYAHQANNWDNRNYAIMFENSGYNGTPNSRFRFILYEDFTIEISLDDHPVWYFITSAKPEYVDKGITDVVDDNMSESFALSNIVANNDRQLWKAVRKSNVSGDKRIHFINKATGNIIQTQSVYSEGYRFTQSTDQPEQSNGWLTRYLGGKQFEIYGTENDGVTRYLNASNRGQSQPDWLLDENTKDTGFAWILKKADVFSAIHPLPTEHLRIYSREKQIIVEGSNDYVIRNLQGIEMKRNTRLSTGIYLVTVNNQTSKIVVK